MALNCQVILNYSSYTAGQTPPPMATVFIFNPNASPVVVTGIQIEARPLNDPLTNRVAIAPSVPPTGPGSTIIVPPSASITIGPFPIVIGSAANANPFQMVNQFGNLNPINPQGSQPAQSTVMIGATVYGSDKSLNVAGAAPLLVSYASPPPVAYQGGFFNFNGPNNGITGWLAGVL